MSAKPTPTYMRDVVVMGCSAGGVEALPRVLQQLPRNLPAALFIVQHMAASSTPYLVGILSRCSILPVAWAEQGDPVERGRALVCPPDVHLLLAEGHVQLTRGPRENHARPAIDKLFRSAAAAYGSRVIGVLLTGMMDDGVAGLGAIRNAGGIVIVQDPIDAAFPELPGRALLAVTPDRMLPIDAVGAAITSLVGEPVGAEQTPDDLSLEVEAAMWSAVRALNDRATTLETLAEHSRRIGNGQSAEGFVIRAREARKQADVARRFMVDIGRAK